MYSGCERTTYSRPRQRSCRPARICVRVRRRRDQHELGRRPPDHLGPEVGHGVDADLHVLGVAPRPLRDLLHVQAVVDVGVELPPHARHMPHHLGGRGAVHGHVAQPLAGARGPRRARLGSTPRAPRVTPSRAATRPALCSMRPVQTTAWIAGRASRPATASGSPSAHERSRAMRVPSRSAATRAGRNAGGSVARSGAHRPPVNGIARSGGRGYSPTVSHSSIHGEERHPSTHGAPSHEDLVIPRSSFCHQALPRRRAHRRHDEVEPHQVDGRDAAHVVAERLEHGAVDVPQVADGDVRLHAHAPPVVVHAHGHLGDAGSREHGLEPPAQGLAEGRDGEPGGPVGDRELDDLRRGPRRDLPVGEHDEQDGHDGHDGGGDDGRRGRAGRQVRPPGGDRPGDAGVGGHGGLAHQGAAGEQQGQDADDDGDEAREGRHGRYLTSCVTLSTLTRTSRRSSSRPVSRRHLAPHRRVDGAADRAGVGERPGPHRHPAAQARAALEELDLGAHHVGVRAAGGRRGRPLESFVGHQDAAVAGRRGQPQGVGVVAQHQPDEPGEHDHGEQQQPGQQRVAVRGDVRERREVPVERRGDQPEGEEQRDETARQQQEERRDTGDGAGRRSGGPASLSPRRQPGPPGTPRR